MTSRGGCLRNRLRGLGGLESQGSGRRKCDSYKDHFELSVEGGLEIERDSKQSSGAERTWALEPNCLV